MNTRSLGTTLGGVTVCSQWEVDLICMTFSQVEEQLNHEKSPLTVVIIQRTCHQSL